MGLTPSVLQHRGVPGCPAAEGRPGGRMPAGGGEPLPLVGVSGLTCAVR
jgi:hypothetical protein